MPDEKQYLGGQPGRELAEKIEAMERMSPELRKAQSDHATAEFNAAAGLPSSASAEDSRRLTERHLERKCKELEDFRKTHPPMVDGDE